MFRYSYPDHFFQNKKKISGTHVRKIVVETWEIKLMTKIVNIFDVLINFHIEYFVRVPFSAPSPV